MLDFLVISCAVLLITYLAKTYLERRTRNLPPGPWGLPFLGYAPFLSKDTNKDYLELHKKYGPIFGVQLGQYYTVVLADHMAIREAFKKDEFVDRQPRIIALSDKYDNMAQMNGLAWKETRRFTMSTLRNLGMGKNKVEESIKEEVSVDLERLRNLSPGEELNLDEFFHRALTNVILAIVCGVTFQDGDNHLKMISRYYDFLNEQIDNEIFNYHYSGLGPFTPLLSLFRTITATSRRNAAEAFFWSTIESREKVSEQDLKDNFLDYFIKEIEKNKGEDTSFTRTNMLGNALILAFGGSDTLKSKLTWLFLYLAQHPEKQEKLHQEVTDHLGKEKPPSWSDKTDLQYTMAFVMEVIRCKTIISPIDHHWCSAEGTVAGYTIPKNTILSANLYAVHFNEKLWGDPENFRPERFLSKNGKEIIPPDYWIPFLPGKRSCPGEKLAMQLMFLIASSVVQKFKILPPKDGLSLHGHEGGSLHAEKPVVCVQSRD